MGTAAQAGGCRPGSKGSKKDYGKEQIIRK